MSKLKSFVILAILAMLVAGCVPVPAPVTPTQAPAQPAAATPVTQTEIVDIVWQWMSVTDQTTKETTSVPNPESYTIVFNADGTLTGKADCNTFGGAYSQESGFTIKLGPSTMAYCGEASLDATYLQLLSSVAAGGPDGAGNLALETAGGAQRMLFKNGGTPQDATPSESSANMIQPQQVSIDTQGLPYSWQANLVPATPYDASQPPGPMGLPRAHRDQLRRDRSGGQAARRPDHDHHPGDRLRADVGSGGQSVRHRDHHQDLHIDGGAPVAAAHIRNACASPRANHRLQRSGCADRPGGERRRQRQPERLSLRGALGAGCQPGDRRVTAVVHLPGFHQRRAIPRQLLLSGHDRQAAEAGRPDDCGLGQVQHRPAGVHQGPGRDAQRPGARRLAARSEPARRAGGLMRIQGMPRSGLHDVVWQWTGSTYQGKENPIADPSLYQVVYGSDGTLSVKADCNQASGTYTYDGGMVGSVRVTMGPSTLAACGPDSRSEELINSLTAAQDYRVQPGGSELKLNMPAGGPVLSFRPAAR